MRFHATPRSIVLRALGRRRRAFTVVEVLVALVVVTVGLLGVAGASAMALKASNAALRERAAITRARTRLALLVAAGCTNASDGEVRVAGGVVERWSVGPTLAGVRLVEARAQWDDAGRRRVSLLSGALLC